MCFLATNLIGSSLPPSTAVPSMANRNGLESASFSQILSTSSFVTLNGWRRSVRFLILPRMVVMPFSSLMVSSTCQMRFWKVRCFGSSATPGAAATLVNRAASLFTSFKARTISRSTQKSSASQPDVFRLGVAPPGGDVSQHWPPAAGELQRSGLRRKPSRIPRRSGRGSYSGSSSRGCPPRTSSP